MNSAQWCLIGFARFVRHFYFTCKRGLSHKPEVTFLATEPRLTCTETRVDIDMTQVSIDKTYCLCRDTGMQALRLCLLNSSVRPSDRLLQDIEQLLELYIGSPEDSTRTVAAACLGTLCRCLDDEQQLTTLVNSVILGI